MRPDVSELLGGVRRILDETVAPEVGSAYALDVLRGATAVRWTLVAMALLVLAFFGSKFVLELVLHRTA